MSDLKFKLKINKINEYGVSLVLQNVRGTFVKIAKPSEGTEEIKPAYEITALIPKKEQKQIDKLVEVMREVIKTTNKFSQKAGKFSPADQRKKALASTKIHGDGAIIKDGDQTTNSDGEVYDGLEGHYIIKAKTGAEQVSDGEYKPKVNFAIKDRFNDNIPPEKQSDELYSGAWYDISIQISAYAFMKKNFGLTSYLGGVMKLKNGERIGGHNPFESREDVKDDMEDYEEETEY